MFAVAGDLDAAQKDFSEAFKRATFGVEEKRLGARLDGFLDKHAEIFLAAPDEEVWGRAEPDLAGRERRPGQGGGDARRSDAQRVARGAALGRR